MKLGLSSYTYPWAVGLRGYEPAHPLDEHALLDRCHEQGLKLLQIGDNLPLHTFDSGRLARFADRARQEGVQLEVGARRLTVAHITTYAELARRIGARLIRLVIDDADYHPTTETVHAVLRESNPVLDGLVLGLENHDRFPARTLRQLIESTGSDRFGICLDTANSFGAAEDVETVVRELAPVTVNLHIKDFAITRVSYLMGFTVEGRPAGGGMLNLPHVLQQLTAFKRCETAVLEQWPPPEPRLEDSIAKEAAWAAQGVRYLRPFFP